MLYLDRTISGWQCHATVAADLRQLTEKAKSHRSNPERMQLSASKTSKMSDKHVTYAGYTEDEVMDTCRCVEKMVNVLRGKSRCDLPSG